MEVLILGIDELINEMNCGTTINGYCISIGDSGESRVRKWKPSEVTAVNIFEFRPSGVIVSDYWGIASDGSILPMGGKGGYVTEEYTIRQQKTLFFHVEDGRYISKSSDSSYTHEEIGFAERANVFEHHWIFGVKGCLECCKKMYTARVFGFLP